MYAGDVKRALLLVAIALAGCGGSEKSAAPPAPAATPKAAPAIEGTTLAGKRISLADFRGRPVLVNVWSSW